MNSSRELKQRKDRILAITINQYIDNVCPVSSKHIAENYNLDLSPATIRHILAELEEEGFLTHPHTSAGRIPTQLGYRYYVDNLMREITLLNEEKERIKEEYQRESLELEFILDRTSKVISDLTHYTSIVSVDGWGNKVFCRGSSFVVGYPEYQNDVEKIRKILFALDEKEKLLEIISQDLERKVEIYIGHEIAYSNIDNCSLVVSKYKFKKGPSGRIAVLGPIRMDYEKVISTVDFLSQIIEEV